MIAKPVSWFNRFIIFTIFLVALLMIVLSGRGQWQNNRDSQLDTHPFGCAPHELYLSAQGWWANATGEAVDEEGKLANDFGHLHTELCFPYKATVQGQMTLKVKSILHNNPGELRRLMVQIFHDSETVHQPRLCDDDHAFACLEFDPPRTLANCEATGGSYVDAEMSCTWWDTLTVDTAEHPFDGWQQVRVRGFVLEPDGEDMRTSTGLHVYLNNGQRPVDNVYENPDMIEARGWYGREVNYTNASILPVPITPVAGLWWPTVELKHGFEGIPVTHHVIKLDANAHQGIPGVTLLEGVGEYRGSVMIDTTKLENGWHRLTLKADAFHKDSGSTNSGIAIVYFEVLNDPPCHVSCQAAVFSSMN